MKSLSLGDSDAGGVRSTLSGAPFIQTPSIRVQSIPHAVVPCLWSWSQVLACPSPGAWWEAQAGWERPNFRAVCEENHCLKSLGGGRMKHTLHGHQWGDKQPGWLGSLPSGGVLGWGDLFPHRCVNCSGMNHSVSSASALGYLVPADQPPIPFTQNPRAHIGTVDSNIRLSTLTLLGFFSE